MWNYSLLCKSKELFYQLSYNKIKASFRYLLLQWYVYFFYHERLLCTYFTITIFFCWDDVLFILFSFFLTFLSFYRHSFIPFILRNCYDFHLFFSFTFEFYHYKTISRDFFVETDFQGIKSDHYFFLNHKMFQSTTCIVFFSLAYVTWECWKYKVLEPNTEQ